MDFFKSQDNPTSQTQKQKQPSNSELLSNAKLVAEAAKSTLANESDKVDKPKVAGAAADLLGAGSRCGKLEEKSFGKYVEKAEDYLHKYESSHSATSTVCSGHSNSAKNEDASEKKQDQGDSGSGYGDYVKIAEGFLKKN